MRVLVFVMFVKIYCMCCAQFKYGDNRQSAREISGNLGLNGRGQKTRANGIIGNFLTKHSESFPGCDNVKNVIMLKSGKCVKNTGHYSGNNNFEEEEEEDLTFLINQRRHFREGKSV